MPPPPGLLRRLFARRASIPAPHPPEDATATDQTMMRRALKLAAQAALIGEVPVGAVVYGVDFKGDAQILGEGFNRREIDQDPSAHAEYIAILKAAKALGSWRLEGCTLVMTLEPCAMCAGLIVNARIPRVVYGAKDPKGGFAGSLGNLLVDARLNHRVHLIAGVAEQECSDVLKRFFADLRKQKR